MSHLRVLALSALAFTVLFSNKTNAQSSIADNELKRMQGHWRITEMVENGSVVTEN